MGKTGRNDPCPCGSGRKYKHCCLGKAGHRPADESAEFTKRIAKQAAQDRLWRNQYGNVRPILHWDFKGYKFVAVGNQLHYSKKWKTFPDFLFDYIISVFGSNWGNAELTKPPPERHQVMQWYVASCDFQRKQAKGPNGIYEATPSGPFAGYMLLAYDLYVLRHHAAIQARLVARLKNHEQFQGARYELFVAATCIRAGFAIEYEDEQDRRAKHPEFIATHKRTGQKVAVEAKSKHRPGVLGFAGKRVPDERVRLGIVGLLNEAIGKKVAHPLVIFVDLNLPPSKAAALFGPLPSRRLLDTVDRANLQEGGRDLFYAVVLTNHPHHYGTEDQPDPRKDTLCIAAKKPYVSPKYVETVQALLDGACQYGNVPQFFPKDELP